MKPEIPSAADIRLLLAPLTGAHLARLAALSGVPWPTIAKMRNGETKNPGIETVRKVLPHVEAAQLAPLAVE